MLKTLKVSFVILTFNHEAFISDAIKSAFAQTYSPLEIIISDDCSTDKTFEIIMETVKLYRGPHTIKINRNNINIGVVAHHNKILSEFDLGDFIVESGGDDISHPERTEVLVDAYIRTGASLIASNYHRINEQGQELKGRHIIDLKRVVHFDDIASLGTDRLCKYGYLPGATYGFERVLFDRYGPLPVNVLTEDISLVFWSSLAKGCYFVDRKLIKYRIHFNNATLTFTVQKTKDIRDFMRLHNSHLINQVTNYSNLLDMLITHEQDYKSESTRFQKALSDINQKIKIPQLEIAMLGANCISRLIILLKNANIIRRKKDLLKMSLMSLCGRFYYIFLRKKRLLSMKLMMRTEMSSHNIN